MGILRRVNDKKNYNRVAYSDRGTGNDPKLSFLYCYLGWSWEGGGGLFCIIIWGGVGRGGGVVFHHQGSTFLQWAIWE